MPVCAFPNCKNHAKTLYCIGHAKIMGTSEPPKEKKPIKQVSDKQAAKLKDLKQVVKGIIKKGETLCAVQVPGICKKLADAPEHTKGRIGKNLTDKENLIPCCNPCNGFLSDNPQWARDNGFAKSRLAI